ncbi:MAG: hypothetical protein GIKADHBN_00422 [Phycisphaerales bacterium]|nr:hypothetical protein [Phycisphaerales bacterium]
MKRGLSEVLEESYPALRRIAVAKARTKGVEPSSLVHDTVCRLLRMPDPPTNPAAIEGVAWQLMDWIVMDRLRADRARKERERREQHVAKDGAGLPSTGTLDAIYQSVRRLAELDPRKAEAILLWSVSEMSLDRIAGLLNVSSKTVQRDIEFAKAWLAANLTPRAMAPGSSTHRVPESQS